MGAERLKETWQATTGTLAAKQTKYLDEGDIVDRYRIGRILGIGGHGIVYSAHHVELGYPVALKVMEEWAVLDPRRRARFRREALVGAHVRHRNIVSILESGELATGAPYLVMEHVEGLELASMIARGTLSPEAAIDLGIQLMAALTALEARGVVHRDIKPQNVMVQRSADDAVEVKLLDFGIVKAVGSDAVGTLTEDGFVLGTPHYMSPEQVRGESIDVRSDLYGVSCVLYEALTGTPPVDGASSEAVLTKVLVDDPVPVLTLRPECPEELADIVMRGMEKSRDRRWNSPAAMAEALAAAARDLGLPRGGEAWTYTTCEHAPAPRPVRGALYVVPDLGTPQATVRELPTLAERPSALKRSRSRPRFRPPWWPAAAAVLVLTYAWIFEIVRTAT